LVTEYIDGYALDAEQALKPDTKKQIELAIKDIQSIQLPDLDVLNYELYVRDYCNQLSPHYLDKTIKQSLLQIASNIDAQDWSPVLCHHDLIPENIIQGAGGLFIIDWEYASIGHPQFDYLRLINSHQIMDIPVKISSLQALQAIMVQLWYAIRYPNLQDTVKNELIKIIEMVNRQ
jgi:aminoglycoside/choline kinase family phosphotransferase